jgi:hypothetical protein
MHVLLCCLCVWILLSWSPLLLVAPSLTFIEKMEFINQLLSQVIKQKKMTMPYDVGIPDHGLRPLINDLTFNLHTMYSATIVDLIIVACSFNCWGSSCSSSYGSWIDDYLCNLSNHHYRCEFESRSGEVYSMQHYVIKFVSGFRQVCGFLRFLQPIKLKRRHSWNIVEGVIKHHNPNVNPLIL